ncbi:MAG: amidohydrolase family protein [Gemmatimonadota bacterium]|nr:amidohydrolase family protein [Gemmatimonadota bacterium]
MTEPRMGALLLASALAIASSVSPASGQDPEAFIGATAELYTNLTLIDGRGGPPEENAAILVWNGRIQGAGPRSSLQVPQGTQIVDLEGSYVIPGLIDAHAAPRDSATLASMLALGITAVREAAMPLDRFRAMGRDVFAEGPLPAVYIGGPILEGPAGSTGLSIESADGVTEIVESLTGDDGAEFVSVAETVPWEWVRDIARAARAENAPVWLEGRHEGWVLAVRSGADVASGLVSLDPDLLPEAERESFRGRVTDGPRVALPEWLRLVDPAGPEVDVAVSALLSRDAAVVPLLSSAETPLRCVSSGATCGGWSDADRANLQAQWPKALALVRTLYDQEIRLLAGSGRPSGPVSGARFHRELQLLVEAGIPPLEIISIATRNAAIALGELHRRGTIEEDKQADFVILDGDPTRDIRNAARIRLVVLRGRAWAPKPEGGFERIRFR